MGKRTHLAYDANMEGKTHIFTCTNQHYLGSRSPHWTYRYSNYIKTRQLFALLTRYIYIYFNCDELGLYLITFVTLHRSLALSPMQTAQQMQLQLSNFIVYTNMFARRINISQWTQITLLRCALPRIIIALSQHLWQLRSLANTVT